MFLCGQTILGACALAQGLVPYLLQKTPKSFFDYCNKTLEENAAAFCEGLQHVEGLTTVRPRAAMYAMVGIDLKRFPQFPSEVISFVFFFFFFLFLNFHFAG